MDVDCDFCGKDISIEQAEFSFKNYHECLCPDCICYLNGKGALTKMWGSFIGG